MSNQAINWAYKQQIKGSGRKFVLVALADFADEDGSCFPSQARIAAMTGQSRVSVNTHMKALEESGHIVRERRADKDGYRQTDRFYLQMPTSKILTQDEPPMSKSLPPMSNDLRKESLQEPKNLRTLTEPRTSTSATSAHLEQSSLGDFHDSSFDDFWNLYPLHKAKPAALKAWNNAVKRAYPETIIAGVRTYLADPYRDARFTAHPATWLNADRWADETPVAGDPWSKDGRPVGWEFG